MVTGALKTLAVLVALTVLSILVFQRVSDGPYGPLAGGELTSGDWTDFPADWGGRTTVDVELQLVEPMGSRTVGGMVYQGAFYIPCDLGFMWARLDGGPRWFLHLLYVFKDWHEHAVRDGRVVLRIDGRRYAGQVVRVTDEPVLVALRHQLEKSAAEYFAPSVLGPRPVEPPNDVWFFRIDPR